MKKLIFIAVLTLLMIPHTTIARSGDRQITTAPLCSKCHQPEANIIRGFLKSVSFSENNLVLDLEGQQAKISFNNSTNLHNLNSFAEMKNYIGDGFRVFYVNQGDKKLAMHIARLDPMHLIGAHNILGTAKVAAMMSSATPPILIDIRPRADYLAGHIKGAINIPGADFTEFRNRPPLSYNTIMIIYGKGHDMNESEAVINTMALGYQDVRFYQGGINDWSREHFTVCSRGYVRKTSDQKNFFLRLVDENNILVDGKGLPSNLISPPDKIRQILAEIPRDRNIIIYGANYEDIAGDLVKRGYRQVKIITNGNSPWQERLASITAKDCSN